MFNTVWTLGCRPFMNSQRAACICAEEEKEELWGWGGLAVVSLRDRAWQMCVILSSTSTGNTKQEKETVSPSFEEGWERRRKTEASVALTLFFPTKTRSPGNSILNKKTILQTNPAIPGTDHYIHKQNFQQPKPLGSHDFPLTWFPQLPESSSHLIKCTF